MQPGGEPHGSSPNGGSPDWDPPRRLPLNPLVGFYGWPTLDLRMFMPPWYPLVAIQSKLTSKLPYKKLQYPTYMKDTDLDVHIKV